MILHADPTGWAGFDDGRRRGYRMAPGWRGGKWPRVKWKGYQNCEPSDSEVSDWRRKFEEINPIMITGKASDIGVLDADGLVGQDTIREQGGLPVTVTVESPRGAGHEHYWFKYLHGLGTIHSFTGGYYHDLSSVDFKADGGVAVYPGAANKEARLYRFKEGHSPDEVEIADLPPWLYEYIKTHNERLEADERERQRRTVEAEQCRAKSEPAQYQSHMSRYAEVARRTELDRIRYAPPRTRNNQLNLGAYRLARFLDEGVWTEAELERDLELAAIECGLAHDPGCGLSGIRATIRSGLRAGQRNRVILPSPKSRYAPHIKIVVEVGYE